MKQRHLRHQSQGGRCLLCFNCRDSNSRKKKNQLEESFAHKNPAFEVKKTSTSLTSMATFPAMSSLLQLWGFRVQMMLQLASFLLLETCSFQLTKDECTEGNKSVLSHEGH